MLEMIESKDGKCRKDVLEAVIAKLKSAPEGSKGFSE
jgi:hypothetical protein